MDIAGSFAVATLGGGRKMRFGDLFFAVVWPILCAAGGGVGLAALVLSSRDSGNVR